MEITAKQRRILIWVAAFFVAYTVIGFLILPYTLTMSYQEVFTAQTSVGNREFWLYLKSV
ncbi:MAG: hypothetical protein V3V95_06485 [Thermodesulfobacteriota bacterium]